MLNSYFRDPTLTEWNKQHIQKRALSIINDNKYLVYPTILERIIENNNDKTTTMEDLF